MAVERKREASAPGLLEGRSNKAILCLTGMPLESNSADVLPTADECTIVLASDTQSIAMFASSLLLLVQKVIFPPEASVQAAQALFKSSQ
jgi:hypothetical protein